MSGCPGLHCVRSREHGLGFRIGRRSRKGKVVRAKPRAPKRSSVATDGIVLAAVAASLADSLANDRKWGGTIGFPVSGHGRLPPHVFSDAEGAGSPLSVANERRAVDQQTSIQWGATRSLRETGQISLHTSPFRCGGPTLGLGLGASAFNGKTNTVLGPIGHIW
jgi:hypothetical protein